MLEVASTRLHQAREAQMEDYDGRQIVGMDLHRRRSVLVRMTEQGRRLGTVRITNSPDGLARAIGCAGMNPRIVLEATYGWYWAADVLAAAGAEVHLAHPLGVKAYSYRRVKNDVKDAADLADLLRMGRLPEAWLAPGPVRELRELTRFRCKLVNLRTNCKNQVHAVLAKLGIPVTCSDLFGGHGSAWLDGLALPAPYAAKVTALRQLITILTAQVAAIDSAAEGMLISDPGYRAILALPGIGPVLGTVIAAEIGDVTRFASPGHLASWAGLTPRHRESDTRVSRGHVTKQGSRQLRWALGEAIQRAPATTRPGRVKDSIIARRGPGARNIAKVAAARELLTLIYYGLRDGHIRSLPNPARAAA
jgi:transposase